MTFMFEVRRRARHLGGPVLGCLLLGYFIFHAVEGDRGFLAWQALDGRIADAEAKLGGLRAEREALEKKVAMLHPENIDPDLLTEQARLILHYLARDEFVLAAPQDILHANGNTVRTGDAQAIPVASSEN